MMECGFLKIFGSFLLLLPAVFASVNRDDAQGVRVEWCNRMCPNIAHVPSVLEPGNPVLDCPNLNCCAPVCPTPACPPPPPPPACEECPEQPSFPARSLPWKTFKTYASTALGYYKYYADKNLDWFDAQAHCESEGAHLLILNSEEEDTLIRNEIRPGWIHIGVHHLLPDGDFTTVFGKPVNLTGFNTYLSGHTVRNVSNNCGFINKSRRGIGIGPCNDAGRFVCEISFG